MAVNFPNNPVISQTFEAPTGVTYIWDGEKWNAVTATSNADFVNITGDTMIGPLVVPSGATGTQVPQVQEVVQKTGDTMSGDLFLDGADLDVGGTSGTPNLAIKSDGSIEIAGAAGTSGYVLTSGGTGASVTWAEASGGGASVTTDATPPGSPADGDMWWDTTAGQLFVYYDDGDTQQWVEASPSTATIGDNSIDSAALQNNAVTAPKIADNAVSPSKLDRAYLEEAGGNLTGAVTQTEVTITSGSFDLSDSNFFTVGAITVPTPTNAVTGQSGLIRITAGPVVWASEFKFPDATAPSITAFPAIIPFYVQDSSNILMGQVSQGIA